jgi:hypothetical protein
MGQDGVAPGLRTMFDPVMERACLDLMQGETGVPAPDGESESFRRLFEGVVLARRLEGSLDSREVSPPLWKDAILGCGTL